MAPRVVILGTGGGSRDVLDILDACNSIHNTYDVLGFIVDPEYSTPGALFNDRPVLGGLDWLSQHVKEVQVICGVGRPELRRKFVERARSLNATFCSVIHPSVIHSSRFSIGVGSSIAAGCVLTNQIQIGDHVQINVACTMSHDVTLHNYVTLSPGVHLAGNVTVDEGCFLGIGAMCIEKKRLGRWSIIGAGSTILKDVPPNTTVAGVPGRIIKTRTEGWYLE